MIALFSGLLLADVIQGRDPWTVIAGSRDEYRLSWKMVYSDAGENVTWARMSLVGFVGSAFMLFSNLLFISINLLACSRRGYSDLWLPALASPFYWLLGGVAAWKGAWQLITRPHYWEKTVHGLTSHPDVTAAPREATS